MLPARVRYTVIPYTARAFTSTYWYLTNTPPYPPFTLAFSIFRTTTTARGNFYAAIYYDYLRVCMDTDLYMCIYVWNICVLVNIYLCVWCGIMWTCKLDGTLFHLQPLLFQPTHLSTYQPTFLREILDARLTHCHTDNGPTRKKERQREREIKRADFLPQRTANGTSCQSCLYSYCVYPSFVCYTTHIWNIQRRRWWGSVLLFRKLSSRIFISNKSFVSLGESFLQPTEGLFVMSNYRDMTRAI